VTSTSLERLQLYNIKYHYFIVNSVDISHILERLLAVGSCEALQQAVGTCEALQQAVGTCEALQQAPDRLLYFVIVVNLKFLI
jgi:hypothetical protein